MPPERDLMEGSTALRPRAATAALVPTATAEGAARAEMDGRRTVGRKRKMTGTPVTAYKKQKMGADNVFLAAPVSEAVDGTLDSGLPADGAVSEEVGDTQDPEVEEVQTPVQPTWGSSKTFLEAIVDEAMAKGEYNATIDSIWPKTRNLAEQGDDDEMEAYAEAVFLHVVRHWSKKTVMRVKLKLDAFRNGTYMELSMKKDEQLSCAYTDWYTTVWLHRRTIPESEYHALLASGFIKVFKRNKKYVPPFDERFRDYLQKKVPVPAQPSSSAAPPVSVPAQPAVASSSTAPPPPPPVPPHLQRSEGTKEKLVYDTKPAKADTLWVERMQKDGTVEFIKEMDAAEAVRLAEEKEARINEIWHEVGPKGKQKAETQSTKASSSHAPTGAVPPKAPTGAPPPASLGPIPLRGYNEGAAVKATQQTQPQTQTQTQTQPVLRNMAWPRDPVGQVEASVPKLQQMLDLIQAAGSGITMRQGWRPFVMQTPDKLTASRCWAKQKLIVAANDLLPNKGIKFAWNSAYQLTFRSETRDIGVEETAYLAYLWRFVVMPYHEHLKSYGHKPLADFVNFKFRQLGADPCRTTTNVTTVDIATAIQRRDAERAAQAQKVATAPVQNVKTAGAAQPAPPAPKPSQDARVEGQRRMLLELTYQCLRDHVMPGDRVSHMTDLADNAASLINARDSDMRLSASDVDEIISGMWQSYTGDGKGTENAKNSSTWYWRRRPQQQQTQQTQQTQQQQHQQRRAQQQ